MLILHHEWGQLHIGHGIQSHEVPEWHELESLFWTNFMAFLMFNCGFYSVWDAWIKRHEFASMLTIYDGHAGPINGTWCMRTGPGADQHKPVQEFVTEQDGKSSILKIAGESRLINHW